MHCRWILYHLSHQGKWCQTISQNTVLTYISAILENSRCFEIWFCLFYFSYHDEHVVISYCLFYNSLVVNKIRCLFIQFLLIFVSLLLLLSHISCVRLCVTLWTVAYQAPPSMGLPRQEYWSGSLFSVYSSLILIFFILSSLVFFHSSIWYWLVKACWWKWKRRVKKLA